MNTVMESIPCGYVGRFRTN